jgi:hypothetical protein
VDGGVHGAAAELEEAETGLKDGWSGPSTWRRLAADGELAVGGPQQARVGVTSGVRLLGREYSVARCLGWC